jgi:uncharacterized iron-regulated membrane protein
MSIRKCFFWLHLTAGSFAGAVIFLMCFTGVLLSFEKPVTNWAERGVRHVNVPAETARLPVGNLVTLAMGGESGVPTSVVWHDDPSSTVEIAFGRGRTVFVNPYTGERLGEGTVRVRGFFTGVEGVHRWLGASGEARPIARSVTAAANLLFLFLACSGLYLWWPRNWSATSLTTSLTIRGELQGRAREFNWHNAIGFWSCGPLVVIVTCSVVLLYPWANSLVYRLGRSPVPISRPADSRQGQPSRLDPGELNIVCARAENRMAGWRTISLRLPGSNDANLAFTIDRGDGGRPDKRGQLFLSRSGGEMRWEPFSSNGRGRRWRMWMRFAHTGEAGGVVGQSIAGFASVGGSFLVYTGISLAVRRFLGWRARAKSA